MLTLTNDESMIKFSLLNNEILKLIQDKIFIGRYTEKCYVQSLQTYRDVIIIESTEDIVKNLWKTKKALEAYATNKWIGITSNPQDNESNDCVLWVIINNVSVGKHWFQIQAIDFEAREIILEIKHIQSYQSPNRTFTSIDSDFPALREIFTYQNLRETLKFSTIVFLTIVTFIVEASKFIAIYTIELGYLIVNFIHVSNPFLLGMLEFLTKCVYGLYWLIYAMWRKPDYCRLPNPTNLQINKYAIGQPIQNSRQLCIKSGREENFYISN